MRVAFLVLHPNASVPLPSDEDVPRERIMGREDIESKLRGVDIVVKDAILGIMDFTQEQAIVVLKGATGTSVFAAKQEWARAIRRTCM